MNGTSHVERDKGSAMVITIMVMTVLMVLGTTILKVTVDNVSSSRRSQDAARALDAADAGVTQALTHLRTHGARAIGCSPTCAGNAWGNRENPMQVDLPGSTDQVYRVWIEGVPVGAPAYYRVHSVGLAGSGRREVQVDVELTLSQTGLPLGVFARSVQGGGNAGLQQESIYTTGCVYNRGHITLTGVDAATGLPAAVHSSRLITDSNGNNATCPDTDKKAIHKASACNAGAPFDHDVLGGPLARTSSCLTSLSQTLYDKYYAFRNLKGGVVDGSRITSAEALQDLFSFDDDPLSAGQLEELKAIARQQGTYFSRVADMVMPTPDNPHAVMFFDLAELDPGGVVDLKDITTHRREDQTPLLVTSTECADESLLIVIDEGNARFNGNPTLAASLVMTSSAPYGEIIKANGTAGLIGTVFADKINLVGTVDLSLDECFVRNLAPSLYTASVSNYLEVDR